MIDTCCVVLLVIVVIAVGAWIKINRIRKETDGWLEYVRAAKREVEKSKNRIFKRGGRMKT